MAGYIPLPGAQYPTNAMLDFAPLNRGIAAIGQRGEDDRAHALRQENAMLAKKQDARAEMRFADERADRSRKNFNETVKNVAGFVQERVLTEKDPTRRQQVWHQMLDSHPDLKGAPDAFRDPVTGPELFVSTARGYVDPLDRQLKEAQIAKTQKDAAEASAKFGKTGTTVMGPDGKYYSVRYASDGTEQINPLALPGAPSANATAPQPPVPLTPSRGVDVIGDQMYYRADGTPVRNVGNAITQGEIAKGDGQNIAKVRGDLPEARLRLNMVTGGLDRLEQEANKLAMQPGLDAVVGGLYAAYAPNVSTAALNAQSNLENLKVKISGVVLQSMRDMSKTGGAVGQVTEREWPRLENMIANLDPKQGKEQFMQNLQEVVSYAQGVKQQLQAAYEADLKVAQGGGALPGQNGGRQTAPATPAPDPLGIR